MEILGLNRKSSYETKYIFVTGGVYARASRPVRPDPAFYGFIKAIPDQKLGQIDPTFDHQILDRAEAGMLRDQLGA